MLRRRHWPAAVLTLLTLATLPAGADWQVLPAAGWQSPSLQVVGLEGDREVAVGYPAKSRADLKYLGEAALAPGVYELELTVLPSHTHDGIAWTTALQVGGLNAIGATRWQGARFARIHQPETRRVTFSWTKPAPLSFVVQTLTDADVCGTEFGRIAAGKAQPNSGLNGLKEAVSLEGLELELSVAPGSHVYFTVDGLRLGRLCSGAYIAAVDVDKIRYSPGEELQATIKLAAVSGTAAGTLEVYLENGLQTRVPVARQELEVSEARTVTMAVPLPLAELGYAFVAAWQEADGGRHEASEVFCIARNVYRCGILFAHPIHNETFADRASYDAYAGKLKRGYHTVREIFFWAEEDMVELSPQTDHWFSGQTTYHLSKDGLREMIAALHRRGIAAATYGKFIMSGYLGWRQVYDYPYDNKRQYTFPVGQWESTDVPNLDRFRNKEFAKHFPVGGVIGESIGRLPFMPITPDPVPFNVRLAAEEMVRSVEMFGWDAVRWDGHPRGYVWGGNSIGGWSPDKYNRQGHLRTQALVALFKDTIAQRYPSFQHGYNYLGDAPPNYDWAVEDYELDELCRGGGLLMNEAIGNHGYGQRFGWFAKLIQVQGDLTRERGGYLLTIGHNENPRDLLGVAMLSYAGGARTYGSNAKLPELNRYALRYACYVLDENLVRLASPEQVIEPAAPTSLWWQPFIYETPRDGDGRSELVVNLLNLSPGTATSQKGERHDDLSTEPGSDPNDLKLQLPDGYIAESAKLIDPFTLDVSNVAAATLPSAAATLPIPSVATWRVLVIGLRATLATPTLGSQFGPPATVGRKRETTAEPAPATPPVPEQDVVEVNKRIAELFGDDDGWWTEDPALAELSMSARNEALFEKRLPLEDYLKVYPYGLGIPGDGKLAAAPPQFGDLRPLRNQRLDVFFARGAFAERLQLEQATAGFDRLHVHEARYVAAFGGKQHRLEGNVGPRALADYDVCVYADVPHAAIGVQQAYALRDYVTAGGAALFVGGESSFGKGRYAYTILDRELLPVRITHFKDNRYVRDPLFFEPGPDFAELGVDVDFAVKPAFWAWQETPLRTPAEVSVFVRSGNRPLIVGWQVGKGRVACVLAMYRGHSEGEVTAWFDWADWPGLLTALLRWLTPDYALVQARPQVVTADGLATVREQLEGDQIEDLLAEPTGDGLLAGPVVTATTKLSEDELRARGRELRRLARDATPDSSQVLVAQLLAVDELPIPVLADCTIAVAATPPAELEKSAQPALVASGSRQRGLALVFLAIAGAESLPAQLAADGPVLKTDSRDEALYRAMAVAFYQDPRLLAEGRDRVTQWNAAEDRQRDLYTGGRGFSLAAPEIPLLPSDALFARVAWLAYLARIEPVAHAAQLTREFCLLPQYGDWGKRRIAGLREGLARSPHTPAARQRVYRQIEDIARFSEFTSWLSAVIRPQVESVLRQYPAAATTDLLHARFLAEIREATGLLGDMPIAQSTAALQALAAADHPLLRDFAAARMAAAQ